MVHPSTPMGHLFENPNQGGVNPQPVSTHDSTDHEPTLTEQGRAHRRQNTRRGSCWLIVFIYAVAMRKLQRKRLLSRNTSGQTQDDVRKLYTKNLLRFPQLYALNFSVQAEQAMDFYVQEAKGAYYRAHVHFLEHQMQANTSQTRSNLQQVFLHQTAELQVQAAAAETVYGQLWEEHRINASETDAQQQHKISQLRREMQDSANKHGVEIVTAISPGHWPARERTLQENSLRQQAASK